MPDEKISIAQRIRDRLDAGALVRIGPKKMWGRLREARHLRRVRRAGPQTQVEYEYVVDTDVTYRFHIGCAGLWQAELKRRGWDKLDDGTSAVGP